MKRVFGIIVLIGLSFAVTVSAQSRQSKKAFRKAARHYRNYEFSKAIPHLRSAVNLDPTDPFYAYLLGECLVETGQLYASLPYFERAFRKNQEVDPLVRYYLGCAYHISGEFGAALSHLNQFLETAEVGTSLYGDANVRKRQCEAGLILSERPAAPLKIENLGEFVNTRFPEYAASFSQSYETMIFTSRRPKKPANIDQGELYAEDISEEVYTSEWVDGTWMKTRIFSKQISKFTHDAGIGLSEDGRTLFYYVDRDSGDVFVSTLKENGKWDRKKSIGDSVNTRFHEPSAFISQEGTDLFFVSTQPGGQGGKDIWWTQRMETGEWGKPQNLGPRINTEFDEDAPFLSKDGNTLYFASNGHNSMGGYDIFAIEWWGAGALGKRTNMGMPINSPGDDIYYIERRDEKGFYLTSDRPGGYGEKDIYFGRADTVTEVSSDVQLLAGKVMDFRTSEPMPAEVRWVNRGSGDIEHTTIADSLSGEFELKVSAEALRTGRLEVWVGDSVPLRLSSVLGRVHDQFNLPQNALVEILPDLVQPPSQVTHVTAPEAKFWMPVEPEGNYYLRVSSPGFETVVLPFKSRKSGQIRVMNIELKETGTSIPVSVSNEVTLVYFDSGQDGIKSNYQTQLRGLASDLKVHSTWKVRVVGFADPVGSTTYNQALSRKRAQKVAQYLIQQGAASFQVSWNGKGELKESLGNESEGALKLKRRVEVYLDK